MKKLFLLILHLMKLSCSAICCNFTDDDGSEIFGKFADVNDVIFLALNFMLEIKTVKNLRSNLAFCNGAALFCTACENVTIINWSQQNKDMIELLWQHTYLLSDGKHNCRRSIVLHFIVFVSCCTLEPVIFVHHILGDNKNRSLHDCSTDQVRPLIRRLWIAFCWTLDFVSRFIRQLSRSYLQIFGCI